MLRGRFDSSGPLDESVDGHGGAGDNVGQGHLALREARQRKLDAKIAAVAVVRSGDELVATYARLRADCVPGGHALGQREHDADRWIAATALRLGIPLVSNDRVLEGTSGLQLDSTHLAS